MKNRPKCSQIFEISKKNKKSPVPHCFMILLPSHESRTVSHTMSMRSPICSCFQSKSSESLQAQLNEPGRSPEPALTFETTTGQPSSLGSMLSFRGCITSAIRDTVINDTMAKSCDMVTAMPKAAPVDCLAVALAVISLAKSRSAMITSLKTQKFTHLELKETIS